MAISTCRCRGNKDTWETDPQPGESFHSTAADRPFRSYLFPSCQHVVLQDTANEEQPTGYTEYREGSGISCHYLSSAYYISNNYRIQWRPMYKPREAKMVRIHQKHVLSTCSGAGQKATFFFLYLNIIYFWSASYMCCVTKGIIEYISTT